MTASSTPITVAVAIITNAHNEVLLAKRQPQQTYPGLWEFPGGKQQHNETRYDALCREINEEVGLIICNAQPWLQCASPPPHEVLLDVWQVLSYEGEAYGKEGQRIQWVPITSINPSSMPPTNREIVEALQRQHSVQQSN